MKNLHLFMRNNIKTQIFLTLLFEGFFFLASGQTNKSKFIDPTGIYKTHFNNSENKTLPQGTIKIKLLKRDKIVVSFYMQNGEPLLRSGSFFDTLTYQNDFAEFKNAEIDSTCKITLHVSLKGIEVKQASRFENYACDFANGVNANGFYYKKSSQIPKLKYP